MPSLRNLSFIVTLALAALSVSAIDTNETVTVSAPGNDTTHVKPKLKTAREIKREFIRSLGYAPYMTDKRLVSVFILYLSL